MCEYKYINSYIYILMREYNQLINSIRQSLAIFYISYNSAISLLRIGEIAFKTKEINKIYQKASKGKAIDWENMALDPKVKKSSYKLFRDVLTGAAAKSLEITQEGLVEELDKVDEELNNIDEFNKIVIGEVNKELESNKGFYDIISNIILEYQKIFKKKQKILMDEIERSSSDEYLLEALMQENPQNFSKFNGKALERLAYNQILNSEKLTPEQKKGFLYICSSITALSLALKKQVSQNLTDLGEYSVKKGISLISQLTDAETVRWIRNALDSEILQEIFNKIVLLCYLGQGIIAAQARNVFEVAQTPIIIAAGLGKGLEDAQQNETSVFFKVHEYYQTHDLLELSTAILIYGLMMPSANVIESFVQNFQQHLDFYKNLDDKASDKEGIKDVFFHMKKKGKIKDPNELIKEAIIAEKNNDIVEKSIKIIVHVIKAFSFAATDVATEYLYIASNEVGKGIYEAGAIMVNYFSDAEKSIQDYNVIQVEIENGNNMER